MEYGIGVACEILRTPYQNPYRIRAQLHLEPQMVVDVLKCEAPECIYISISCNHPHLFFFPYLHP